MRFRSKLPDVGTTIFTVMSRRAIDEGALNVGQGFPDYPIDPRLAGYVRQAIDEGHNQYAPMEGVIELRDVIAGKLAASYGVTVDPQTEITVTCGATESLYDAIQAAVGPGDEAIVFDPAYDAYEPAIRLAGGRCAPLDLFRQQSKGLAALALCHRGEGDRRSDEHGDHHRRAAPAHPPSPNYCQLGG